MNAPIRTLPKKTISELIAEAIEMAGGRAGLEQIYSVVQNEKPKSYDHAIRGVLYQGVDDRKFIRNPDNTYSLGIKDPKVPKRNGLHGLWKKKGD
jgi:hypothetical protein